MGSAAEVFTEGVAAFAQPRHVAVERVTPVARVAILEACRGGEHRSLSDLEGRYTWSVYNASDLSTEHVFHESVIAVRGYGRVQLLTTEGGGRVMRHDRLKAQTDEAKEMHLRRQAIQVCAQLPEEREDALRVLDYARELVTAFMHRDDGKPRHPLRVV